MAVTEGLEGREDVGPQGGAGGLEVDEEGDGLRWVGVENAVDRDGCVAGVELGVWVLFRQNVEERVDVERFEGAVPSQARGRVANV